MTKTIQLTISDGVELIGDLYPAVSPRGAVLLLHMMPADRTSWQTFAAALVERHITALAIDLRGHGESIKQGKQILNYQTFSDRDHQASSLDVEAALAYLRNNLKFPETQLGIVGASIGANLALQALNSHPTMPYAVLLSPGLTYHGVETTTAIGAITPSQHVYLAASNEDEYAYKSIRELNHLRDDLTYKRELSGAGHGTDMLTNQPELMDDVIRWINEINPKSQAPNLK